MTGAIETRYAGCRFRSRLEARWAVFFDALTIPWQYEAQGYTTHVCFEDGCEDEECSHSVSYLPDFLLPDAGTFVEVKGSDALLAKDAERLEAILDWGSPLPGMSNSYSRRRWDMSTNNERLNGLLLLGDIPRATDFGLHLHPIIQHHEGLNFRWAYFDGTKCPDVIERSWNNPLAELLGIDEPREWSVQSMFVPLPRAYKAVLDAYQAARSARFEHGESPA